MSDVKVGDQVIALEDAYFPLSISKTPKRSQAKGELLLVNTFHRGGGVSGAGLNRVPRTLRNRPNMGLGCSFQAGTYRLATPEDPGYLATREQWHAVKDAECRRLRFESFAWSVVALLSLGALALRSLPV